MTRISLIGALVTLGLAAPALAHEDGDDHDQYHDDLAAQHALEHQRLEADHDAFHAQEEAEHQALHESGNGWGLGHWLWHRREARRHMLEHWREQLEHQQQHQEASAEHDAYHRLYDPANGYGGDGYRAYGYGYRASGYEGYPRAGVIVPAPQPPYYYGR